MDNRDELVQEVNLFLDVKIYSDVKVAYSRRLVAYIRVVQARNRESHCTVDLIKMGGQLTSFFFLCIYQKSFFLRKIPLFCMKGED